jgi:hypothetical protein
MKTGTRAVVVVLGAIGLGAAPAACSFDLHEVATEDTGAGGAASSAATTQASTSGSGSNTTSSSGAGAGGTGTGGAGTGGAGAAGGGGTGGTPTEGCSDGSREAYTDAVTQPNIAGCSGGWSVPGLTSPDSMMPQCGRVSGNDSPNQAGTGCSVADLCGIGWHVCLSHGELYQRSADHACPPDSGERLFWATRQSMIPFVPGDQVYCTASGDNNVYGCGDSGLPLLGGSPDGNDDCGTLDRVMGANDCEGTWICPEGETEGLTMTKNGTALGGVLCCRD